MRNLAIVLALVAGCGNGEAGGGGSVGSYDAAADKAIELMNKYGSILDGVKDKATAEAAKPKLEDLAKRLQGLVTDVERLGPPRDGAARGVDEKMQAALESLGPKTTEYVMRVIDTPEMGKVLETAFVAVQGQIIKLRGMLGG
ncbi:MAG: hypothetical protein ACHQ1G_11115 [Planctomycetota bacterium]